MARGNQIIVSSNPKGQFLEGIIDDTSLPGTIMEVTPLQAASAGGVFHFRASRRATGKGRLCAVLREDQLQGFLFNVAYVAGTRCFLYVPIAGEDVNVLVAVVGTGTGAAGGVTVGEPLEVEPGGFLTVETGSPQSTPFMAMEALPDTTAGLQLTWCRYTGG